MQYNDMSKRPLKGGATAGVTTAGDQTAGGTKAGDQTAGGTKEAVQNAGEPKAVPKQKNENTSDDSVFRFVEGKFGSITFILQLLTLVTPYFIVFFFILVSIINSNIKGFIYVTGLFFVFGIINMFKMSSIQYNKEGICKQLEKYHGDNPSFVIALYSYTIIYMLLPMIFNNTFNIQIILFLFIIFLADIIVRKYRFKCLAIFDIAQGVIFGTLIGAMWAYALKVSGNKSLLYYEDILSNKETCQQVKTNFRCNVIQNGKILSTITPPPATTTSV